MVSASLSVIVTYVSEFTPPGLILSVCSAFVANGSFFETYLHEFVGTLLMIGCTFSAGKWIGSTSLSLAWFSHAVGVIAADFFGGGPHVNPAVTLSMWCLGKASYTEAYIRIAAQMGGGLVAFPIFKLLSDFFGWEALGGPEFDALTDDADGALAFFSEFCSTLLLLILIYLVNFEVHFGKYHYLIKQSLTALGIRYLIEMFPRAGPAMNPMLGTTWAAFAAETQEFPSDPLHYFVYWLAPFAAAILASFGYVVYVGGTFFGQAVPFGPIKSPEKEEPASPPPPKEAKPTPAPAPEKGTPAPAPAPAPAPKKPTPAPAPASAPKKATSAPAPASAPKKTKSASKKTTSSKKRK